MNLFKVTTDFSKSTMRYSRRFSLFSLIGFNSLGHKLVMTIMSFHLFLYIRFGTSRHCKPCMVMKWEVWLKNGHSVDCHFRRSLLETAIQSPVHQVPTTSPIPTLCFLWTLWKLDHPLQVSLGPLCHFPGCNIHYQIQSYQIWWCKSTFAFTSGWHSHFDQTLFAGCVKGTVMV